MESSKMTGSFTSQQCFSTPECQVFQKITLGCPKEIFNEENRVGLTPQTVKEIVSNHHEVIVECGAGIHSGFCDEEYVRAGAQMVKSASDVWSKSQLIVKVMAPQKSEFHMMKQNQIVMAFFNFFQNKELLEAMQKQQITCIDYDNIENEIGSRPVVQPMSEIAGIFAIQQGMKYLERQMGGSGMIIGGITGMKPAKVTILGAGVAGVQAARVAASTGSDVTIMDINMESLRRLRDSLPWNVKTLYLSQSNLEKELQESDLLIGAVFPKYHSPTRFVVSKKQMKLMRAGSVAVDLNMIFGGNFESSQGRTIGQPTFVYEKITHYCATNIWSSVPQCASEALSTSVLPYALQVANKSWKRASMENAALMNGVTVAEGHVTNEILAKLSRTDYRHTESLLQSEIQKTASKTSIDMITLKSQLSEMQSTMNKSRLTIEA